MFRRALLTDFRNAVRLIQEPSNLNTSTAFSQVRSRDDHLRRIRELISGPLAYCSVRFTTLLDGCPELIQLGQEDYISSLQTFLCGDELKEELDSAAPGLRCRAFHIAICVACVSVDDKGALGPHCLSLASQNLFVKLTNDCSYLRRIHRRSRH